MELFYIIQKLLLSWAWTWKNVSLVIIFVTINAQLIWDN